MISELPKTELTPLEYLAKYCIVGFSEFKISIF